MKNPDARLLMAGLFLVCLTDCAFCGGVVAGQEYTGDFVLHRAIPVNLAAGTPEHPRLVEIQWLRMEASYGNAWGATVRVGWSPAANATWRIQVDLLDGQGRPLRHPRDRPTVFTSQADARGGGGMRYAELDLEPMHWEWRRHASKVRLRLEPAQDPTGAASPADSVRPSLVLAVIDGKDRKPIPEATVITTAYYRAGSSYARKGLCATDARGECRIAPVKPGFVAVNVTVQKEEYAAMSKGWSNPSPGPIASLPLLDLPERHMMEMVRAQNIGGIVQDEQGRPIAGVEVMVEAHLEEVGGFTGVHRRLLTDAQGRWQIGGLAPDTDRLSLGFRHPEYAGDYFASRSIRGDDLLAVRDSKHVAVLNRGLAVAGVVRDEQGRPVPEAAVILAPRRHGRFLYESASTVTDSAGRFRFGCAVRDRTDTTDDGGASAVLVEAPGYAPAMRQVVVEPNLAPLEFRLKTGRTLTVRVVSSDERPLASAWAAVAPLTEDPQYDVWQEDADAQGLLQIRNAPDHDVVLTVGKSGYVTIRDHVLSAAAQEHVVTLKPAPRVQGRVIEAETGKPIADFDVDVVSSTGRSPGGGAPSHFRNGEFELEFTETRQQALQLRISTPGYEAVTSESVPVEGTRVLEFKLAKDPSFKGPAAPQGRATVADSASGVIRGVVYDPNGRPAAQVVVTMCPYIGSEAITDAEGKFKLRREIRREPDEDRQVPHLIARDSVHNLAALVEFDRTATQDPVIKLAPGMVLSGRVTDAQGKGMPNAKTVLYLWLAGTGNPLGEGAKTDPNGCYEIRAVPPDQRYSVDVTAEGYGREDVKVPLAEAVNTRVKLGTVTLQVADLEIRGVVVDTDDKPVAGVGVSAYGRGQPFRQSKTDAQGRFTLRGVCAGVVEIQANLWGSGASLHGRVQTEGGANDLKIVIAPFNPRGQFVPAKPPSLVGKPLPSLADLGLDSSAETLKGKMILLCFFDMSQRPSRNTVQQLAKRTDLKDKGVLVVMVQVSKTEEAGFKEWVRQNAIPFPVAQIRGDENKVRSAWGVRSLPRLILADTTGSVRAEGFSLDELDGLLAQAAGIQK